MFYRLNNSVCSILIVLISIRASVYGTSCNPYEINCYHDGFEWCCPDNADCGNDYNQCYLPTTTTVAPSTFPTSVLAVVIMVPSIFIVTCVVFCACAQKRPHQSRSPVVSINNETVAQPYQQQYITNAHIQPIYNVGAAPPVPSTYEAPPPSYEAAIANFLPK